MIHYYSFFTIFIMLFILRYSQSIISEDIEFISEHLSLTAEAFSANLSEPLNKYFTANLSNPSNSLNEQKSAASKTVKNRTLLITFSVVAIVSVLINLRVFCIVFVSSRKKLRPANILVAHLSSVVIGFTLVAYLYILEKTIVFSLTVPGVCHILSFLRNGIYSLFPLNAAAIIWVRTRSDAITLRERLAYQSIRLMWIIAIFVNIPSIFMVENAINPDTGFLTCKQIPLLNSFAATVTYERLRQVVFNVMVCLYILRATVKIRSTMQYLRTLNLAHSERMQKRIQQVHFVQLHTIVFLLNWFPNGLGLYLYKTFSRLGWTTDFVKYLTPFVLINYVVFILCPLSYVFLLEEIPLKKIFIPCLRLEVNEARSGLGEDVENVEEPNIVVLRWQVDLPLRPRPKTPTAENAAISLPIAEVEEIQDSKGLEILGMSGITTVGVTCTSDHLVAAAPQHLSSQQPANSQWASIPAPLTPSTSHRLESIAVQMHVEPRNPSTEEEQMLRGDCNYYDETYD